MANSDKPSGFTPVKMLDGSAIPVGEFPVDSSNATAIYIGDLVMAEADGNVAPATAGVGTAVIGVVTGIKDSNGVSASHPNGDLSTKYLPALTAGRVSVALGLPTALFRIQASSGTAVNESDRFACADHVAGSGSTTIGRSGHELNSSTVTAGAAQLKIYDKIDEPNNDWGEHVDLLVLINENHWVGAVNGL